MKKPSFLASMNNDIEDGGLTLKQYLGEIEQSLLNKALMISSGNRAQAARLLGLNRTTLLAKLVHYAKLNGG